MRSTHPRRPHPMYSRLDPLESRRLLAATLSAGGVLDVIATKRNDLVYVTLFGGEFLVDINLDSTPDRFAASKVKTIRVQAGRGNDRITMISNVPVIVMG